MLADGEGVDTGFDGDDVIGEARERLHILIELIPDTRLCRALYAVTEALLIQRGVLARVEAEGG